jgi:hypothetical protein
MFRKGAQAAASLAGRRLFLRERLREEYTLPPISTQIMEAEGIRHTIVQQGNAFVGASYINFYASGGSRMKLLRSAVKTRSALVLPSADSFLVV